MILKHQNRELLRFDWIRPFGVKNLELNSRERRYLPLEFRDKAERRDARALVWGLEDWLMHRTAPMNRRFVRDVMISTGFNLPDLAFKAASTFLASRVDQLIKAFVMHSSSGPVNIGFTGPASLLCVIRDNPGLRKNVLSKLTGLTERTVKRYLSQLGDKVEFRGAPKTGGYYVKVKKHER